MSWVKSSADGCPVKADIRLNVMTNPFRDVGDGVAHVIRPFWVSVLKLHHVSTFLSSSGVGGVRCNHRDRYRDHTEQKAWQTANHVDQGSEDARPSRRKYFADVPASPSIGGQLARRVRCSANRPVKSRRSRELLRRKHAPRRESPEGFPEPGCRYPAWVGIRYPAN